MVRAFAYVFALAFTSSSFYPIEAVPVERRQLGGVGCNVARLRTVGGLAATTRAVKKLAAADDPAVASAATTAQTGLQDASSGIKTIAGALLTGQAPPTAARDQVAQGLFSAQDALANLSSTDSATTNTIGDAQAKLAKTISAGQDVLDKCGGGGGAAADSGAAADGSATASDAGSADTGAAAAGDATGATGSADSSADATDTADNSGDATANNSSDNTAGGSGTTSDNTTDGSNTTDGTTNSSGSTEDSGATGANTGSPLRNSRIFGKRQIGGVRCNIARLQTVTRLAASSGAVNEVKSSASGDAAVTDAASQASSALASAKGGIVKIGAALITGQKAPAAERDKVEKGLNDAQAALASVNSTDPAVTAAITNAQNEIASTLQAGQAVVSQC